MSSKTRVTAGLARDTEVMMTLGRNVVQDQKGQETDADSQREPRAGFVRLEARLTGKRCKANGVN